MGDNKNKIEEIYSKRIKAGKKRTYFIDVRSTKNMDYYITITESKKKYGSNKYYKHKIFLYKEDFNKFYEGLIEAIDYVKSNLLPDYDFEKFDRDEDIVTSSIDDNQEDSFDSLDFDISSGTEEIEIDFDSENDENEEDDERNLD